MAALTALVGSSLASCSSAPAPERRPPTRLILISVDTLRADHLGAYGYSLPTSPFFDSLAERGTLFENAIVQVASTLPSHASIFTGLYPAEHGVYPPDSVLAPAIPTFPEVLQNHGYRTGAVTGGGWLVPHYGFARGFDYFEFVENLEDDETAEFVRAAGGSTTLESVRGAYSTKQEVLREAFERGLAFVANAGRNPVFLFLHTFVVHDPYVPPDEYASLFWDRPAPAVFEPTGPNLSAVNRGTRKLDPEGLEYFKALYDAQIRLFDDELKRFFEHLDRLGLSAETTVVITADHGEEFLEHGKLVHEQVYHELVHVPLLVLGPGQKQGRRVSSLVESVDLAPTLLQIAGVPLERRPDMSGSSLVPLLEGTRSRGRGEAYAEHFVSRDRTLYQETAEGLYQLVRREPLIENGGTWVTRSITFDAHDSPLSFQTFSYERPQQLEVRTDGLLLGRFQIGPSARQISLDLPGGAGSRVTLSAAGCVSPSQIGRGDDPRCLSFFLGGLVPVQRQLYDLSDEPHGLVDVSRNRARRVADLERGLESHRWDLRSEPGQGMPDDATLERLRALGYLQ